MRTGSGLMTFAKTFTSGIIGHATTLFMAAGTEEGSRSYVATERITGHTDGGSGGLGDRAARRPGVRSGHLVRPHRARHGHRGLRRMVGLGPDPARRAGAYFEIELA